MVPQAAQEDGDRLKGGDVVFLKIGAGLSDLDRVADLLRQVVVVEKQQLEPWIAWFHRWRRKMVIASRVAMLCFSR